MNPADASKTAFMTERKNFYYRVMPFGLKNASATYQRLMDMVFAPQIGRNIEVYVDDMVIKTTPGADHVTDIRETFAAVRKFNMRLNPDKCTFGMQAGKFLVSCLQIVASRPTRISVKQSLTCEVRPQY